MQCRRILKQRIVAPALGLALVAPPAGAADGAETRSTRCSFARLPRLAPGSLRCALPEDDAPAVVPVPMERVPPSERPAPLPEPPFLGRVPGEAEEIATVPIEIGPEEGRHACDVPAPPALRVRLSLEIEWRRP